MLNQIEIFYNDYGDYKLFPINNTTSFKIDNRFGLNTEYYFFSKEKTFFAQHDNLYPLDILTDKINNTYVTSIMFGDAWKDKVVFNKHSNQKKDIKIIEYNGLFSREVVCKRNGNEILKLYEKVLTTKSAKISITGNIEGNELELFISLLSFYIKYDNKLD